MKDVISYFKNEFLKDFLKRGDNELIRLSLSKNPTQSNVDDFLKIWDIEEKSGDKSIHLAYFQKYHPELNFTPYESKRLKGLLTYHRFNNLRLLATYKKIGSALNKAGIIPILMKSGAMKYLRPELPRFMGDIDIVIKSEEFDRALEIIYSMGYVTPVIYDHSYDFHLPNNEQGTIDVHKYIPMDTKNDTAFIPVMFKRAVPTDAFGIKTLIPRDEDMMFILLVNFVKNLTYECGKHNAFQTIFDYHYFLKRNINWDIVKETAKITETEGQLQFAVELLDEIIGSKDLHPKVIFTNSMKELENYLLVNYHARRLIPVMFNTYKKFQNEKKWIKYRFHKIKFKIFRHMIKYPSIYNFFIKETL